MKVMGIVAGRHNGNSEILVKQALTAVKDAGGEAILINLDLFQKYLTNQFIVSKK